MEYSRETLKIAGLLPRLCWVQSPSDPGGWKLEATSVKRKNAGKLQSVKRLKVLVRDGAFVRNGIEFALCSYCYRMIPFNDTTLDHVEPVSRGGKNNLPNLTLSCSRCNRKKGEKSLLEFLLERLVR